MAKEKFVLVSLKENKAKKLTQVLSNETCRHILDYLANKDSTESEISKELNIPISTVHYNMQQLLETGLVKSEEYHYSEKGKEVNHYSLANKYIIIAPESERGWKSKLRSILPVSLIVLGAAAVLQFTSKYFIQPFQAASSRMLAATPSLTKEAVEAATPVAKGIEEEVVADAVPKAVEAVAQATVKAPFLSNIVFWFVVGAISALILYLLIEWLWRRKK